MLLCPESPRGSTSYSGIDDNREDAPIWLVEAIQHDPAALRSALAANPLLLHGYYFGVMCGMVIVELDYCAIFGRHAAASLDLLLAYAPPQWGGELRYPRIMTQIVSAPIPSGLNTKEARPFITRIAHRCSREQRNQALHAAIDLTRVHVAHAIVKAGAVLPPRECANGEFFDALYAYADRVQMLRATLIALIGTRRFRRGPPSWRAIPAELVAQIADYAWGTLEEEHCVVDTPKMKRSRF